MLEPVEAAFHDVSLPVDLLVEGEWAFAAAAMHSRASESAGRRAAPSSRRKLGQCGLRVLRQTDQRGGGPAPP